jgi:predicted alpha/beta-fold hydrolase
LFPHVAGRVRAPRLDGFTAWHAEVEDPKTGTIHLSGRWRAGESDTAVVLVHGLGGGLDSPYMHRAAAAVQSTPMGCLMLAVRGAARAGEDFYHAGQTVDIATALRSPELSSYRKIHLLGFSLGGHMALRLGLDAPDNLGAIAAVCSPLDLAKSAQAIDAGRAWLYRRHILRGLREIYGQVAARKPVPTPVSRIQAVRTIREWDALTVVPRYGFESVDQYYASMSVGPRLSELEVPTLIVHSDADPMVPGWAVEPALRDPGAKVETRRVRAGGHVGFPHRVDLGLPGERGLEGQVLAWFSRQ